MAAGGEAVVHTVAIASGKAAEKFIRLYSDGPSKLYQHSPEDFATFFGPLELVPPGIGDARTSHPGSKEATAVPNREGWMITGIARVG